MKELRLTMCNAEYPVGEWIDVQLEVTLALVRLRIVLVMQDDSKQIRICMNGIKKGCPHWQGQIRLVI